MGNSQSLFNTLFKKNIPSGDNSWLQQLAEDHPYFAPAQFFLLQQLSVADAQYPQQARKTSALFNNPYWLSYQLNRAAQQTDEALVVVEPTIPVVEPVQEEATYVEPVTVTAATELPAEQIPPDATQNVVDEIEPIKEDILSDEPVIDETIITTIDEHIEPVNSIEEETIETTEIVTESEATDIATITDEPDTETLNSAASDLAFNDELVSKTETAQAIPGNQEIPLQSTDAVIHNDDQQDSPKEDETANEPLDAEPAKMMKALHFEMPETTEDTITFEPLHTTDYFASLGIKLSEEPKANDKLGIQLRSFTDWLKTMKKIHAEQLAGNSATTDPNETTIQSLAEKSNKGGDVVTEAMAEVLIQQGKAGKALEVYKKLSLLNPAKSAYFAAKINQLNEQ